MNERHQILLVVIALVWLAIAVNGFDTEGAANTYMQRYTYHYVADVIVSIELLFYLTLLILSVVYIIIARTSAPHTNIGVFKYTWIPLTYVILFYIVVLCYIRVKSTMYDRDPDEKQNLSGFSKALDSIALFIVDSQEHVRFNLMRMFNGFANIFVYGDLSLYYKLPSYDFLSSLVGSRALRSNAARFSRRPTT